MIPASQRGNINPLLITSVVLGVLVVGLLAFGVWSFMNYMNQKNNVDAIVSSAVNVAKQEQLEADEKSFLEREKLPTRQLVGPSDLGKATIDYPKTWSVYIDKDGTNSTYTAYLHPGAVGSVTQRAVNAVVVSVESKEYEDSLNAYTSAVEKGDLKASPVTIAEQQGTRLDGTFSKDVQGSAVLFKLRDKTLKISVQSNDYLGDFNNIILPSLKFNP